eukprot:8184866-Pyramimonas_sp.AAC.1
MRSKHAGSSMSHASNVRTLPRLAYSSSTCRTPRTSHTHHPSSQQPPPVVPCGRDTNNTPTWWHHTNIYNPAGADAIQKRTPRLNPKMKNV